MIFDFSIVLRIWKDERNLPCSTSLGSLLFYLAMHLIIKFSYLRLNCAKQIRQNKLLSGRKLWNPYIGMLVWKQVSTFPADFVDCSKQNYVWKPDALHRWNLEITRCPVPSTLHRGIVEGSRWLGEDRVPTSDWRIWVSGCHSEMSVPHKFQTLTNEIVCSGTGGLCIKCRERL